MRRRAGRAVLALGAAGAVLWTLGPYEPAELTARFDPARFGAGVETYFKAAESRYDDITPGVEKRVIRAPGHEGRRSPVAVLYLHGFSATSEEIRPVPDRVAKALGANLVYTRLSGHGRGGAALAQASVADWMADLAEALAAARAVGERVVVIATSTGATLATVAALDADLSRDVAAMVFLSPNFGIHDPKAALLNWPAARAWLPLVAGRTRSIAAVSAAQARYWTTSYPTVALLPMAALVRKVAGLPVERARVPVLFRFCDADQVVRPDITRRIAARWGGPAALQVVQMGPGDDPSAHVIAGDILSPGQTGAAVRDILDWLKEQGIE